MKFNRSLFCVLCLAAAPSFAGRPFSTEDAGVLEQGQCELESAYSHSKAKHDSAAQEWTVQPSCGLGLASQLGVGYGQDWQSGVANRSQWLAGKTSLKAVTESEWGAALAYSVKRAQAQGDVYRLSETTLNGVVSMPFGDNLIHANLGWSKPRDGSVQAMTWGVAWERTSIFGPVDAGLELVGDNHSARTAQLGVRWNIIPEQLTLDASLGQQINPERTRTATAGVKVSF